MACGKQEGVAFEFVAAGTADATDTTGDGVEEEAGDTLAEMNLAAVAENGVPHRGNDGTETVGADMGMGVDGDERVGAMLDKFAEDIGDIATLGGAGVELAVAVGARATLAKAPVAVGVDAAAADHQGDVLFALVDWFATLDNDRLEAKFESFFHFAGCLPVYQ